MLCSVATVTSVLYDPGGNCVEANTYARRACSRLSRSVSSPRATSDEMGRRSLPSSLSSVSAGRRVEQRLGRLGVEGEDVVELRAVRAQALAELLATREPRASRGGSRESARPSRN